MRSKILSLSKNEDFKALIKGKKINNKYLTIFFKKLSDKSNKKLNCSIVAKRKIGNAIFRNRAKRRVKNIMHQTLKNINLNYSYLLIAKKSINVDKFEEVKKTLFSDFKKIK